MEPNFNSELNQFVIQHITRLFNRRDFNELERMGLSKESASSVVNLSMGDSSRLSQFRVQIGDIQVDEKRLNMIIKMNQHEGAKNQLIDQMILLEASQSMLFELTGMDHIEYRERRRALDLPKGSSGRPVALTEAESIAVNDAWFKYNDDDNLIRYYNVGMETKISLSRVWQHLQIRN